MLTLAVVCYFLWGDAAAIYKGKLDAAALEAQKGEHAPGFDDEYESDGVTPRLRIHRGSALVAAVVVTIAAVWTFISNSVIQLGNLPSLIPYMFSERMGYLIFCVCVLAITGLGLFGMGRMQQSLESENPFSKGKKKVKLSKIRTPKPIDDD